MTLEKEAQRKSLLNMMGRGLNPMEYARYMFSRKYRDVYNTITRVDKEMRKEALGKEKDLRETIHKARMAYKNREYPAVIYHSWKLQSDLNEIFGKISDLESVRERVMEEFYGESTKLSDDEIRQMSETLGKKSSPAPAKAASLEHLLYAAAAPDVNDLGILKQAGPMQWLKENIPTSRQMEGALFDRIFRNKVGKQKEAARKALQLAEKAFSSMKDVFRQLDAARTDFSSYITIAEKFKSRLDQQTQELSSLYQANFADIVPEMTETNKDKSGEEALPIDQAPTSQAPAGESASPADQVSEPTGQVESVNLPPSSEQAPASSEEAIVEPVSGAAPPQAGDDDEEVPPTMRSNQLVGQAAERVNALLKQAKLEEVAGNRGVSAALLVKASEVCDFYDAEDDATRFILAAEKVLQG